MKKKNRAGTYINQGNQVKAFIPEPLPPEIAYDRELRNLLSKADRAIAKLDGTASVLPNAEWFIYIFVRKEALLSSQIEGTQATMEGFLAYENDIKTDENPEDLEEVVNYIKAMNYGLDRLKYFPLSLRLFKEIHNILLNGVRGTAKTPGEFRRTQNWIGPNGAPLKMATFVPPPPQLVTEQMGGIENFIHQNDDIPPFIKIALIHAQFESIHPFLDGNGRLGRLLITFYLCWKEVLASPTFYMSYYFKTNKERYYDLLMAVRNEGDWEKWIKFFLNGVIDTSNEGLHTARSIIQLKEQYENALDLRENNHKNAHRLLKHLFDTPFITRKDIQESFGISYTQTKSLTEQFVDMGILKEITGKSRYKKYMFKKYVDIIK